MSDQWFVNSNDQQLGPYTGEQLVQFAHDGNIVTDTMVWAEGMAEWLPASQIPGLFPEAPAAPAVAAAPVQAVAPSSPAWAPPGTRRAVGGASAVASTKVAGASALTPQAVVGGEYPYFPTKASSFALWMWSFLGGLICMVIAVVFFSMSAKAAIEAQSSGATQEGVAAAASGKASLGMLMLGLGWVLSIVSMIFFFINLHRAWNCLRAGAPRTTPGKAVGMMFIPIYNIYWVFVAIAGLPKDWNRIVASYEGTTTAPRLSEGVFLMYCIGMFFPPLAMVVVFPMMAQICKGVNFFASRRNPNAPAALGGFKFR